jgi:N-methylhydantoinase A
MDGAFLGTRNVLFEKESRPTNIYRGEAVPPGVEISGPAVLEFFGTSVVVGPGGSALIDEGGNIVIQVRHA